MFNSTLQGYNAFDARFARALAMWFFDLGTSPTSNFTNLAIKDYVSFRYCFIQPFLATYSPHS